MDLATLRSQVREIVEEKDTVNLTDAVLNDLVERSTQRIETDYADDYGVTPRQMMASDSGTILSAGYPLPSDFMRARSVRIGSSTLRYIAPESLPAETQQQDATVDIIYYANIPKLVNDTDTNWLLDIASRVYVFATLIEYTLWNAESDIDRGTTAELYTDARDKTARANSPRPSGGFQRAKGEQRGHYSIVGSNMIFGYTY